MTEVEHPSMHVRFTRSYCAFLIKLDSDTGEFVCRLCGQPWAVCGNECSREWEGDGGDDAHAAR